MEPLRTLLFVPGNRANMLEKARTAPADVLVLDMEDSVPLSEKSSARALVQKYLPGFALGGQRVFVRVNALSTGLAEDDLEAVVSQGLDGISLPKAESADDIARVDSMIAALESKRGLSPGTVGLIVWIETARGILKAHEISSASFRLIGVAFGADDFTRDMGIERTKEATEQFFARSFIAVAAQAAGVAALDTPFVDFTDDEGLVRDSRLARQLGFKGKFVIHPRQIQPVNQVFTPSPQEVETARRIVEAFDAAAAQGSAAISFQGRMIDIPGAERARKLLQLAEAIARKESGGK